jgi:microcystin-dependent protein
MGTPTTNKGLILPTVGGESGSWGQDLNNGTITVLDLMLGGVDSFSLSSTTYTLSSSEIQNLTIKMSGTLLANVTVYSANIGFCIVENNTSGNFTVTWQSNFGSGGVGSGIVIPQGNRVLIASDMAAGARTVNPLGGVIPSGVINPFAGPSANVPSGWVLCYGQAISRTLYPGLFAAISTTYGSGDGSTTFNVPDLRGRTLFGLDNMGGTAAGRLTGSNTGNISSPTTLGSTGGEENHTLLTAELASHNHGITDPGHTHPAPVTNNGAGYNSNGDTFQTIGQTVTATGSSTTGIAINDTGGGGSHNTTPPAMVINWIIKT